MNVSPRRRGFLMGVKQTGLTLGGLLGGLVLPSLASAAGWRISVLVPIAACVIVGLLSFWVAGRSLRLPGASPSPCVPLPFSGSEPTDS
jgi:MFS family permease